MSAPTRTATEANADQHLDTLGIVELEALVTITRVLQRLSPISRYRVETQLQLQTACREERFGDPPNDTDPRLAQWEERVNAYDAQFNAA